MAELRRPDGPGEDREVSPADLQPNPKVICPQVTSTDLQQDVDAKTREMEERLARRRADDELITALRARGFRGHRYEAFEEELVSYAWAVVNAWLRRGYIFKLTKRLGRPVTAGDAVQDLLERNDEEREFLAAGVVGVTVAPFRQRALIDGGWSVDGGASLPTYFLNAVVLAFPNEYRRWHTHQVKWARQFDAEGEGQVLQSDRIVDPALAVTGLVRVRGDLARLKPREQAIVAFHYDGYSHEEIMELTGAQSVRAVEGVLHRWRTKEKKHLFEGRP